MKLRSRLTEVMPGAFQPQRQTTHLLTKHNHINMSSKFLDDLPQEIRTQIFSYVLAPTGRIIIKQTSRTPTIHSYPALFTDAKVSLSLLQTCRQIYEEAKDVLWTDNILCFHLSKSIGGPEDGAVFLRNNSHLSRNVRIIDLRFTPGPFDLANLDKFFQLLAEWKLGVLREVWFTISGMGIMSMFGEAVWEQALKGRTRPNIGLISTLFDTLGLAGNKERGYLRHIRRRLNIELGIRHSSSKARREWFGVHPPADCEETLMVLHQCFGGDLYMDGVLCYKEGIQLQETFAAWEAESRND